VHHARASPAGIATSSPGAGGHDAINQRCRDVGALIAFFPRIDVSSGVVRVSGGTDKAAVVVCLYQKGVMSNTTKRTATIGVVEHGNAAFLVTVAQDGKLLDRRRMELTTGLPTQPYHHEGAWAVGRYLNSPWARPISFAEAVTLVKRVQEAAAQGARECLTALSAAIPAQIVGISIRACPRLPATIEERIADNRAQVAADSVMYREALAVAAAARGWSVYWYERERVFQDAAALLDGKDVNALLDAMGRSIGPPWQARHKLAAAAALAAQGPARETRLR